MKYLIVFLLFAFPAYAQFSQTGAVTGSANFQPYGACVAPSYLSGGRERIEILGDSYQLQNSSGVNGGGQGGTDLTDSTYSYGAIEFINILEGQPWYFDPVQDNQASNGGTTATMLQYLPAALARHPQIVFIGGAHNDALNGVPLATTYANLLSIISQVEACGAKPVLIIDPSINSNEGSIIVTLAQLRSLILTYDQFYRFVAQDQGILTLDMFTPTLNPADSAGGVYTTMTDDSIHPNFLGDYTIAEYNLAGLAPIIGPPTTFGLESSQVDGYGTTYNPYGSLIGTSGLFLTTGAASAPFTGVVPTGWYNESFLNGATGKTLTGSVVTPSDNIGKWYQIAVSGTSTGGTVVQIVGLDTSWAVTSGQEFEGWAQFNVLANSPFYNIQYKLVCGVNQSIGGAQMTDGLSGSSAGPTAAYSGILYAPPIIVPTGISTCYAYLQAQYNDAAYTFSGTIQFRRPAVRYVQNPY